MNSNNQKILIAVLAIVLIGGIGVYVLSRNNAVGENNTAERKNGNNGIAIGEPNSEGSRTIPPSTTDEQPSGKLKVANFTGKLEQVNTGCFADGECYVVVDGKHVTTLVGFNRDMVGSIRGVDSISDLEGIIGQQVEVYAQDKGDGTYTLYGSAGFYVKVVK